MFTAFRCACGKGSVGPRVCSDHRGAKEVAEHLGIPHTLLDLRAQFVETVVKPLLRIISTGARPILASPVTATSSSARCCAGPKSKAPLTSPPGITPE